jgi:hypothetical protein
MRTLCKLLLSAAAIFAAYCGLLCVPSPFFPYSVRAESLVLHSDQPFSEAAGRHVLELARAKISRSPLYSARAEYHVFLCNAPWRQRLFFNKDYGAGGVAPYPVTSNVFLRDARVEADRLISPRGVPVTGNRTLDYFIAHEICHQMTGSSIGPVRYLRLPQWVREGYADYVGKGGSFDYADARRALLSGAPEMDYRRSGLYWRFHLLVAYLLDRHGWTVERLLAAPPPQSQVENEVRQEN